MTEIRKLNHGLTVEQAKIKAPGECPDCGMDTLWTDCWSNKAFPPVNLYCCICDQPYTTSALLSSYDKEACLRQLAAAQQQMQLRYIQSSQATDSRTSLIGFDINGLL